MRINNPPFMNLPIGRSMKGGLPIESKIVLDESYLITLYSKRDERLAFLKISYDDIQNLSFVDILMKYGSRLADIERDIRVLEAILKTTKI